MNRSFFLVTALAAGLAAAPLVSPLVAQTASAAHEAAPAEHAAVAPEAIPAKVAVVAFEQAVVATNEGQRALADVQKKYEPKKAAIDTEAKEVDSLKQQLQALPATTTDEERANRLKTIDTKEKNLQRDAEDAQNSYQSDLQEAYGKVAQKVGAEAVKYVQGHGFTLLLNVGGGQQTPNPVLWFTQTTDITQAVVNAYNVSSGVAAPPPSAPAPARRTAPSAAPRK
jgi:Skp family chaperone for outer membrane proteins